MHAKQKLQNMARQVLFFFLLHHACSFLEFCHEISLGLIMLFPFLWDFSGGSAMVSDLMNTWLFFCESFVVVPCEVGDLSEQFFVAIDLILG